MYQQPVYISNNQRMKQMHEQMERMYAAARMTKRLREPEQATLARLLNVAQQNVNNWERRGVSKEGALDAQRQLGISATWVLDGMLPMLVGGDSPDHVASQVACSPWPFGDRNRYDDLPTEKQEELGRLVNAFLAGAEPAKRSAA